MLLIGIGLSYDLVDHGKKLPDLMVTERRTGADFAPCLKDVVDVHFPDAAVIRLVTDQLNTHRPAVLYATFAPEEARRIPDMATVECVVGTWEERRNEARATVEWQFTTAKARTKLDRVYSS